MQSQLETIEVDDDSKSRGGRVQKVAPSDSETMNRVRQIIVEHSEADEFADAVEEWDLVSYQNVSSTCVCGKALTHAYQIKNLEKGDVLTLGQDCLLGLENELLSDSAKIARKMEGSNKMRICACCLKLRISKANAEAKIKCAQCYQNQEQVKQAYKNKYFRACVKCGSNDIPPGSEAWKKTCLDCYAAKKEASRECEKCGMKRISPEEPEYTKICFPCRKESGMKACMVCKEETLYAADWRMKCMKCYKKTRQ